MKRYTEFLKRPEIWAVLAAFFVVIALLLTSLEGFPDVKNISEIIIIFTIGIAAYLLGIRYHGGLKYLGFIPIPVSFVLCALFIRNFLGSNILLSAFLAALPLLGYAWLRRRERKESERIYLAMFCTGLGLFIVNILLNGAPLLNPELHFENFESIFPLLIPSFYMMIYPAVRAGKRRNIFFLVLIVCLVISTLRFYIFIALFAWVLLSLKGRGGGDRRKIYIIIVSIVLSMVLLEGYLYSAEPVLGCMESTARRPAFTLSVFDRIVGTSFPWGGEASCFFGDCGSQLCRELFHYEGRLSSTAFGYVLYSLGIPGLVVCLGFLGALLANLKKEDYPIYCILLPYLITTIERGFTAGEVVVFTYLGYTIIWWRSRYLWKRLRKAA